MAVPDNWPASLPEPNYPMMEGVIKRKISTSFENGIEKSRSTATVAKKRFEPMWTKMTESDFQTLESFFESQGSTPFNWTHPATATAYVVRMPQSELESEHTFNGHRKVKVLFHEVPGA